MYVETKGKVYKGKEKKHRGPKRTRNKVKVLLTRTNLLRSVLLFSEYQCACCRKSSHYTNILAQSETDRSYDISSWRFTHYVTVCEDCCEKAGISKAGGDNDKGCTGIMFIDPNIKYTLKESEWTI